MVRSDIRASIAGADGVPLTVVLELVNTNGACAPSLASLLSPRERRRLPFALGPCCG